MSGGNKSETTIESQFVWSRNIAAHIINANGVMRHNESLFLLYDYDYFIA